MTRADNITLNPLISMWFLLEGKPSSVKINVKPSDFAVQPPDLNELKPILNEKFKVIEDIEQEDIEFFFDKDQMQPCHGGTLLADLETTALCPLIVRYPFSTASSKYKMFSYIHFFYDV